jgi:hypothetical protein
MYTQKELKTKTKEELIEIILKSQEEIEYLIEENEELSNELSEIYY